MRSAVRHILSIILTLSIICGVISTPLSTVSWAEAVDQTKSDTTASLDKLGIELGAEIKTVSDIRYMIINHLDTKVGDIVSAAKNGQQILLKDGAGTVLAAGVHIATGQQLLLTEDGRTFRAQIVLLGDINGDGIIDDKDSEMVQAHIMETAVISDPAMMIAADVNNDGVISALDYVRIFNRISYAGTSITLHFNETNIKDCTVNLGERIILPTAERAGYTFAGWYILELDSYIEGTEIGYWNYVHENEELNLVPIFTSPETVNAGMTITAGKNTLEFSLGDLGRAGNVYFIYALNGTEYYYTETATGQFRNETDGFEAGGKQNVVASGEMIGWYLGGSDYRFSVPRYSEDGYDNIYKKYYVVNGSNVAKGPVWVTGFTDRIACNDYSYASEALLDDFDPLKDPARNKKGVCDALTEQYTEFYGNAYVPIDMPMIGYVPDGRGGYSVAGIVAPNEIVNEETGEITYRGYDYYHDLSIRPGEEEADLSKTMDAYPYLEVESNGTYYYINRQVLSAIDNSVVNAYHCNMYSIGILTVRMYEDQEVLPYYMQYPGMAEFVTNKTDPKANATFQQINTANQIGANYWIALMEFFAWRYSTLGLINVILGNEVDFAGAWNVTADYTTTTVTVDQYTEELYRAVRLAALAFNKFTDKLDISLSFTHYWNWNGAEGGIYTYQPHQIMELMLAKSNAQGNFRWGLTIHNYAYNLSANNIFNGDLNSQMVDGDFNTTKCITITNLEVLEQYLEQDYARYNGQLRPVYLTETGINTGKDNTEAQQKRQAAAIIYHYYKVQMLDAIVCWPYYRMVDLESEGIRFGLLADEEHPRLSNNVWADLGRLSIDEINDKYKDYLRAGINLFDADDDYGTIMQKMADLLGVDYDWDAAWKKYFDYTVRGNRFTTAPTNISTPYTGEDILLDQVQAYKGDVQYRFFDASGNPIDSVRDAGDYKYVAYVVGTDNYDDIESAYFDLKVTRADNGLIYPVTDGKLYFTAVEGGIELPQNITLFGAPAFTVKNADGYPVTRLTGGSYTLTVAAVAETANYAGLPAATYTIEVTAPNEISTYDELVAALNAYYANPLPSTVINLAKDIDCGGALWNVNDNGQAFCAVFNGNGHSISNLRMGSTGDSLIGLFARLGDGAIVRNLTIRNVRTALNYPENGTDNTAPVSIGILAAKVSGTRVQVSDVTVEDVQVEVTNRSAVDHQMEIGGIFGADLHTTAADSEEYLRSRLTVKEFYVDVTENAQHLWIGGIAGTLEGAAPTASADQSQVVYDTCSVKGGKLSMYDPAGMEEAAMGAYIGRLNNYSDITMKGVCTADIPMVRCDARVTAIVNNELSDQPMPYPMVGGNYARYMPSSYYFISSGSRNILGWFGMQTNITGRYYEPTPQQRTVGNTVYTRSTFNIGTKCTCTAEMSVESFIDKAITVTDEQLRAGFDLTESTVYVGDSKTDVTFFRSPYIRMLSFAGTWSTASDTYNTHKPGIMYAPTCNIPSEGNGNCMGYWYNPDWPGGGGEYGWCLPYKAGGATYIDVDSLGYTAKTLTEADFNDLDEITLYGLVTARNGEACWYEVVRLTVTRSTPKQDTGAVLFLGDSVCSTAQYVADVKGVMDNYVIFPYEIENAMTGGWTHSGGWSYLYAQTHTDEMVYNYGVGGATMGDFGREEGSTIPEEYSAFRAAYPDADVRLVVVEMTLNDLLLTNTTAAAYGASVAGLPNLEQSVPSNLVTTTLGATVNLIQQIRADYPNAELVFMTPPERYDEMYAPGNTYAEHIIQVMADLETICNKMQVPVIDLWSKSGLKCSVDNGKTWDTVNYNSREGIHPSMTGYINYLYPCMMKFIDELDESVLLFKCDWLNKETVVFTRAPQPLTAEYTGEVLTFQPDAEASYGTVTYRYFDMDGREVEHIVDAGTYQYKAYVKGDRTHEPLESDFVPIMVKKAQDRFTAEAQPITCVYSGAAAAIEPSAAAENGQVTYVYYLADKVTEIDKSQIIDVGTYYYKAVVAESKNYERLESDFISITINKRANSFTTEPQPITLTYTGLSLSGEINPNAVALWGTPEYEYFDANKTPIEKAAIKDAGTYYFVATVAAGDTYEGVQSQFVSITVGQAKNGLAFQVRDGVLELPYENEGTVPSFVLFGTPTVTITKANGTDLAEGEKLEMNTTYTLVIGPVEETANYEAFAGGTYTLSVIGTRAINQFTVTPETIRKDYDGIAGGIEPAVAALYGEVVISYYDAEQRPIDKSEIVNAGTYYYKATVAQSNTYEGLDSGYKTITVNPVRNALVEGWTASNGVISRDYVAQGTELPAALTEQTAGLTFAVTNAVGQVVDRLTMGDYTLTLTGTGNYTGLSETYIIHVDDQISISDGAGLIAALSNYYANPSDQAVLTLVEDIDCGGAEWTQMGNRPFVGTFNGDSHKITGLKMTDTSKQSIGFFTELGDGAVIKNLTIDGAVIELTYPEGDTSYNGSTVVGVLAGTVTGTKVKISDVTISNASIKVTNHSAVDHEMSIGGLLGADHYTTAADAAAYLRKNITVSGLNSVVSENAHCIGMGGIAGTIHGASKLKGADGSSIVIYDTCQVNTNAKGKLELYDRAGTVKRGMGAYAGRLHNYTDITLTNCQAAIPLRLLDARITVNDGTKLTDWIMPELLTNVYTNFVSYYPSSFNPDAVFTWLGWFGVQDGCENRYWEQTTETNGCSVSTITNNGSTCTTVMKTLSNVSAETITISADDLKNGGYQLRAASGYVGDVKTDVTYFRSQYVQDIQVPGVWNVGKNQSQQSYLTAKLPVFSSYGLGYWYVPGIMPADAPTGWVNLHGGQIWFDPTDPSLNLATTTLTEADFADTDTVKLYGYSTLNPNDPNEQVWGYYLSRELTVKLEKQENSFINEPQDLTADYTGQALTFTPGASATLGQVTYRYYDASKNEIASIIDAGTYYYKAVVAPGASYDGLESDYKTIIVRQTANAFTAVPAAVTVEYTGSAIADPSVAAKFGTVSFEYYDEQQGKLSSKAEVVNAGTYYYKAVVAETGNYTGLQSELVRITINKTQNSFTVAPQPITVTYTGSPADIQPQATAQSGGEVTFQYYAADQTSVIDKVSIVEGGTYYYKAVVEADANYDRLESDFVPITVQPAANGLLIEPIDGTITVTYANGGEIPGFVRYGTPTVTITKANGTDLAEGEKLEMNTTYTLVIGQVEATANYEAFAGGTYTLSVTGDRAANEFTTAPVALTVQYGDAITPVVSALYGEVSISYYNAEQQPIDKSEIVNVGTYYYKATVVQSNTYEGLDSGYKTITVNPAPNSFITGYAPNNENVILVGYDSTNKSCTILPEALTTKTSGLTYTLTNANGEGVGSRILNMGEEYTLTFTGAENYIGIGGSYTVRYGIADYDDLVQAMDDYSAASAELPLLTLVDDIDCAGNIWTPVSTKFIGTFDGASHKITGLKMTDTSKLNIGFFGELGDGAVIKNLTIDEAVIELTYPEGDTSYSDSTTVGVLAGKVTNTKVQISDVTISNASIKVTNNSSTVHQMEIGGLFGVDRRVAVANAASYLRKNITITDLNIDVTENAEKLFLGGIAGSLVGNKTVSVGDHPAVYENCNVSGGKIRMYDPLGTTTRVMGAYFGRLNNYSDLTLRNCNADIALTMIDARVMVNAGGTFTDWVMPDAAYGDSFASYLPSSFNHVVNGVNLMGWIGMQWSASNRWWTANDSTTTSAITLDNSTCTSIMRTESVTKQSLQISRSELASGYQLKTTDTYTGTDLTQVLYFRQPLMVEWPVTASWDVGLMAGGTIPTMTPVTVIGGTLYQIAYWRSPDGGTNHELGWNLFHGGVDGNTVTYFNPISFDYATTTLTEADFASGNEIKLYGLVTVPSDEMQHRGWKQVIELTVTLVD